MPNLFIPGGPPRFTHQKLGLRKIIETGGVHALLFQPGTGKTATVIDYASLLAFKHPNREARVLVVAPLAALDTWVDQPQIFAAEGLSVWAEALGGSIKHRAEALAARGGSPFVKAAKLRKGDADRAAHWRKSIKIRTRPAPGRAAILECDGPDALGDEQPRLLICAINFDSFASRASVGGTSRTSADEMIEAVRRFRPDLIVLDESHKVKGAMGNTSKSVAKLTPLCKRRIILTGTLMPHSPLDVYGQWRFLQPTAFGSRILNGVERPMSFGAFKARYATMGGFMGKEVIGYRNLDQMQNIMARNSTVAKKSDVLDLPAVTEVIVPVHLSKPEEAAYLAMKTALAVQFSSGTFASVPNTLAQLMRLRQITSGYLPDDLGGVHVIGDSKVKVIKSLVQDTLAGESRVVIFAHFTHEIQALTAALADKNTTVETITGATDVRERGAIRERFGSNDPTRIVLIAQIKTMSLAVNELVTASHAIFASLSQQRDDYEQAVARLDRQGQTKPVTIWVTAAPKTVDEVVYRSIKDRTNLEQAMLAHITQVTT